MRWMPRGKRSAAPTISGVTMSQSAVGIRCASATDQGIGAGFESGPLAALRLMNILIPHLQGRWLHLTWPDQRPKRWDIRDPRRLRGGEGGYPLTDPRRCLRGVGAVIRSECHSSPSKSPGLLWWSGEHTLERAEAFQRTTRSGGWRCKKHRALRRCHLCGAGSPPVGAQSRAETPIRQGANAPQRGVAGRVPNYRAPN